MDQVTDEKKVTFRGTMFSVARRIESAGERRDRS